jgi:glycosyltransferase involved in cell wall biosynthesis
MPSVYNALDIATSSSAYGEGFPNVVGEAMACGLPCVVTDVGDSARIVGETGVVVPPRNPAALAEGLKTALDRLEGDNSYPARARVTQHFSVQSLILGTERALAGVTE